MTTRQKIEAIRNVQEYEVEIQDKLETIIKSTSDSLCYSLQQITIGDKVINVEYLRGLSGDLCDVDIPIEWLDDGFDYVAAYRDKAFREREERLKKEAEAKALAKLAAENEEYKTFLRLKKKFESQLSDKPLE